MMKRVLLAAVFYAAMMCGVARAEAGVLDWPIISQGNAVVKCLAADSGTIVISLVTHLSAFAVETFKTVGQCLIYTTAKLTPLPDVPE